MKAAVIQGARSLVVEHRPDPTPGPGEVLVRIRSTGICGSDIHGFEGLIPDRRPPGLIMGHEAAGEIEQTGEGVEKWRAGDRVAIDPQVSCGACNSCLRGWGHLCDNRLNLGSSMLVFKHGTLCELISLPERQIHRMPDEVSYDEGAMVEPASCALHIFNRARLEVGAATVIIGTGAIGLIAVQVAKLMGGGKVIGVDRSAERLELARGFGADVLVNSSEKDPVDRILKETDGAGADAVVEAVGKSQTYDWSVRSVRKRGQIMALGYLDEEVPFAMRPLIFREVSVIGCTGFTHESDTVLKLMALRRIDVRPLITHRFPLGEINTAFETACSPGSGAIKVMVHP